MPKIETTITTLLCDVCGKSETHTVGSGSVPVAIFFYEQRRWAIIGDHEYACPRCAPILDTVTGSITASLDRKLART